MAKIDDPTINKDELKKLISERDLENSNAQSQAIHFLTQPPGTEREYPEALMRGFEEP